MEQWEEGRRMRYVTSVERIGIQKGLEQGLQQGQTAGLRRGLLAGIELMIEMKFGAEGLALLPEIQQIQDLAVIEAVHAAIKDAQTLDELRQVYAGAGDAPPAS
jgi:flagellar biosynthesis/type III secretory pathway protein FliH